MRPLHALLVVVALVLVCGLSWLVIRGDDSGGLVAPASRSVPAPEEPAAAEELAGGEERVEPTRSAEVGAPATSALQAAGGEADADRPRAARTEIAGRVVDDRGRALGGVRVLAAAGGVFLKDLRVDEIDRARTPWLRVEETETGADGRFVLAVADQAEASLALRRAGHAPYDASVPLRAGERRDLGDLVLEPGVVLEGRVVDAGGRGVAGAELRRERTEGGFSFDAIQARGALLATTDEGGGFRIDQLAPGAWRVTVLHELHPDAVFDGETQRAGDVRAGLVFELEDGLAIRGRVLGVPDDVLERLEVVASPEIAFERPLDAPPAVRRRVAPGADGAFVVQGLRAGERYRLQGRASEGRGDFFGRAYTEAVAAAPGDRDVDLVFRPETAIVFQVVDDATGEPLTRFDVRAGLQWPMPHVDDSGRFLREHPEGRVRFGNLNPKAADRLTLSLDAVGYERFERTDIALAAGRDNDLGVIRLAPAPTVVVRVVDGRTGAPVRGARVRLREVDPVMEAGMRSMSVEVDVAAGWEGDDAGDAVLLGTGERVERTDADGVARLTSLPGKDVRIAVGAAGYAPSTSGTLRLPADKDYEHEVRLGPGASVIVRVVDGSGAPVAGVEIAHEGPGGDASTPFGAASVTDAAGELRFEDLAPGAHAFRIGRGDGFFAMSSGGEAVMRMSRTVQGGPAERADDWVEVELVPGANEPVLLTAPTRTEVAGVVSEGGRPLAGASVKLVDPDGPPEMAFMGGGGPEARTNGRGEYRLSGVEVGRHRFEVTHASRAMPYGLDVAIDEGDNEVDIDLPLTAIVGTVVDHEGEPVAGAKVTAKKSEGGERRAVRMVFVTSDGDGTTGEVVDGDAFEAVLTDAAGRYELRGVTPDQELVVEVSRSGAQPARSKPLRVAPGETREGVDLELVPGGRLAAVLERSDGSGASMVLVTARFEGEGGVEPKTAFTGADGRASFDGLRPGRWILECREVGRPGADGAEIPPTAVDVAVGDNPDARVTLP